jgi:hypothetical protein
MRRIPSAVPSVQRNYAALSTPPRLPRGHRTAPETTALPRRPPHCPGDHRTAPETTALPRRPPHCPLCGERLDLVLIFEKTFFSAKILCTYTMNYLRQEKCLRDHGAVRGPCRPEWPFCRFWGRRLGGGGRCSGWRLERGRPRSGLAGDFGMGSARERADAGSSAGQAWRARAGEARSRMAEDRSSDRSLDRGLDRGLDRSLDRGLDRGLDRSLDRSLDRGSDRSLDRSSDRGSDRGLDRGSDRGASDRAPTDGPGPSGGNRTVGPSGWASRAAETMVVSR